MRADTHCGADAASQGLSSIALRDADELRDRRLPVYARAVTSRGVYKTMAEVAVVPVSCGGVMLSRT